MSSLIEFMSYSVTDRISQSHIITKLASIDGDFDSGSMSYSIPLAVSAIRGVARRLYTIFRPPRFGMRDGVRKTDGYTRLPRLKLILAEEANDSDGHVMRLRYITGQSVIEHFANFRGPGLVPSKRSPTSNFSSHPLSLSWGRRSGARWASTIVTTSAEPGLPTREYLAYLKSIYPGHRAESGETVDGIIRSSWYLVVAVAFGSSNRPESVPKVFQFVHDELTAASASIEERRVVVRRLKEAIFKSGLSCGYSRVSFKCCNLKGKYLVEYLCELR